MNVYRHGQHIPNSPFKIYVGETEIGNAGRVKVYGKGLSHGMANELNEFFVNTKDAGNIVFIKFVIFRISSYLSCFHSRCYCCLIYAGTLTVGVLYRCSNMTFC